MLKENKLFQEVDGVMGWLGTGTLLPKALEESRR